MNRFITLESDTEGPFKYHVITKISQCVTKLNQFIKSTVMVSVEP